ncbi:MAG: SUMF1/EgtB/PvdO family nonheme iron enzyme [Nitrospirae bacterium]|nr:SUMF1/EgtB/PvdO family nonheme iron enzyme [Nitrospirota bacterium]
MNCPNCGNFIRNPINFCPYCRAPLNAVVPSLIEIRHKRKPGKTVMIALILLFIAFAAYHYKGSKILTFVETMFSRVGNIKGTDSRISASAPAAQGDIPMPKPPEKYTDPVTGIDFVFVRGGCYRMGDVFGDGDADEKPPHEVCVNDFYMSKFEVTQGQWVTLMGKNPSSFAGGKSYPVEKISWQDTQNFINVLKKKNSVAKFRLPTEAEWEYACRSGGKDEKWAGTGKEATLGEYAWSDLNSGGKPHPVGSAKPNGLGLYDMSGNVWEWVEDDYAPDCYQDQEKDNPICIRGRGGNRVIRGGNWYLSSRFARCTARSSAPSSGSAYSVGFRLVREK